MSRIIFSGAGSGGSGTIGPTGATGADGALNAVARAGDTMTGPLTVPYIDAGTVWTNRQSPEGNQWYSIAYGNGIFVAVSWWGRVMTSDNGIDWTTRASADPTTQWLEVVFGDGKFVAVGQNGTTLVMTSTDGITWTPQVAAVGPSGWDGLAYGEIGGNPLFVACASYGNNQIMTSPDGVTWTGITAPAQLVWYQVSFGNGTFVIVDAWWQNNPDGVLTSTDGVNWIQQTVPARVYNAITYGLADGVTPMFVAVLKSSGSGNTKGIVTSIDNGVTWSEVTTVASTWLCVHYDNGVFIATRSQSPNQVFTSTDGVTWTPQTTPLAPNNTSWISITYGDGIFVAVSNSSSAHYTVMTSADNGGTWVLRRAPGYTRWTHAAYGNGVHVAASAGGVDILMTSPDAITWTVHENPYRLWRPISFIDGLFYSSNASAAVVVTDGAMITSPDGINWTRNTAIPWYNPGNIVFGNGVYVAIQSSNTVDKVITSTNGINWSFSSLADNSQAWRWLAFGNGVFVAVANGGTNRAMYSSDGVNWTTVGDANGVELNNWVGVTFGNGKFVAIANGGATGNRVMTSIDGITWECTYPGDFPSGTTVVFANGLFVASATGGTYRIATSPDGVNWAMPNIPDQYGYWQTTIVGADKFVSFAYYGGISTSQVMTSNLSAIGGVVTIAKLNVGEVTGGTVDATAFTISGVPFTGGATGPTGADGALNALPLSGGTLSGPLVVAAVAGGATWTPHALFTSGGAIGIAYGEPTGSPLYVAVGYNQAFTSVNGIEWTTQPTVPAGDWGDITYGDGLFVAVASGGDYQVMTSPDGINWTPYAPGGNWSSVAYGNGTFVATSGGGEYRSMYSTSAVDWNLVDVGAVGFDAVTFGAGVFLAVGWETVSTSPDGITWTPQSAANGAWSAATYGLANGVSPLFVVVAYSGGNRVLTSPDGIVWTPQSAAEANYWQAVTYGNGLFVSVSADGANRVMTSADGVNWVAHTAAEANNWQNIVYGDGQFIAVAANVTNGVMTSPAGSAGNVAAGSLTVSGGSPTAGDILVAGSTAGNLVWAAAQSGPTGPTGPIGNDGFPGEPGLDGATGATGPTGFVWSSVPGSTGASGSTGDTAYDTDRLYVCVGLDTWKATTLVDFP